MRAFLVAIGVMCVVDLGQYLFSRRKRYLGALC